VPLERGVAVASGVSARNVARFCEAGATAFLVASSIALNGDFHHLDPILLRELIAALPRSP
jgi:predicted TIM-barrel enzyme